MKQCSRCKELKEAKLFYKRKNSLQNYCKACSSAHHADYQRNRHAMDPEWYAKEIAANRIIKWKSRENPEVRNKDTERSNAWSKANPDKASAKTAKRRATKLQATPKWLTQSQLKNIQEHYSLAKELAWLNQDGKTFHVDHIIPLKGKEVSGLHVPWNLQLLPKITNLKKGNRL